MMWVSSDFPSLWTPLRSTLLASNFFANATVASHQLFLDDGMQTFFAVVE